MSFSHSSSSAHTAYARHQAHALTGRALEAAIFDKCAADMHALVRKGSATPKDLFQAGERNREFWALCLASCADPDSPLPHALRVNMGQLAVFVEAQMRKAIAEQDVAALEPIIYINRHLAAGLRGQAEGELPPLS